MAPTDDLDLPVLEVGPGHADDDLGDLLREFQFVLLRHPVAAQAAFTALVAEGRRFADTPEGKNWEERLRGSDLVRRGRVVWEVVTLKMLEESPVSVLPTTYLDALVRSAGVSELEPMLARLFELGANEEGARE